MVSLPLLAKLLDAIRPDARLVLVGDPFQLTSIEAGTVMGDLVGRAGPTTGDARAPLAGRVTELRRGHRFGADSGDRRPWPRPSGPGDVGRRTIDRLRRGTPRCSVRPGGPMPSVWLTCAPPSTGRRRVVAAAPGRRCRGRARAAGPDQSAGRHPSGTVRPVRLDRPDREAAATSVRVAGAAWPRPLGTPVMVTGNDPVNRLLPTATSAWSCSRDGGRAVGRAGRHRATRGVWPRPGSGLGTVVGHDHPQEPGIRVPARRGVAAGGRIAHPHPRAPLHRGDPGHAQVTVVGSEESVRAAVERPVARASGLRDRLWT